MRERVTTAGPVRLLYRMCNSTIAPNSATATAWQTTRAVISLFAYLAFVFVLNAKEITPAKSTPSVASMAAPSRIGRMASMPRI